ncbi:aldo/keto reductase [Microbispora siamensis]|uniref:Aldo/keto reductase n=1 Tax=Microbispora siamensis TaxID=564413 RepID=A0ABQ4GRB9_9ACTN|nr:aldo/keto reductase [Microbispora siamensis]GIH63895.1 aldo/keto reductase [Microbispora siamensis]
MRRVSLGGQGLVSTSLGLGCTALTGAYGPADPDEAMRVVRRALDGGVSLIDLIDADAEAERLVGKAVAHRRDEALIAAGPGSVRWDGSVRWASAVRGAGAIRGAGAVRGAGSARWEARDFLSRPENLGRACDASLARLGIERIDLFVVDPDASGAPIEETMGVAGRLQDAGKIAHIGVRALDGDRLRRAHAARPVAAVAVEYSLWQRRAERELLPVARELGIGVIAGRPLGRGFLTGRITSPVHLGPGDVRCLDPRFSPENLEAELLRLRDAQRVAAEMDVGMGRLAIAWLLARGDDIVPVPSTRDLVHLEMNLTATGILLPEPVKAHLARTFPLEEG